MEPLFSRAMSDFFIFKGAVFTSFSSCQYGWAFPELLASVISKKKS